MARIRTIDNDAIPGLLRMIKGSKENRKHALNAMQQMIKNGDYSQIKYLVSENCANQLCDMLTADLDTSLVALTALKHVSSCKYSLLRISITCYNSPQLLHTKTTYRLSVLD